MFPYMHITPVDLFFGLKIQAFGVLVAVAFIVGNVKLYLIIKEQENMGHVILDTAAHIGVFGFFIAHLVAVVFYFPERIKESVWALFDVFHGISSFGGFIGGAFGLWVFCRRFGMPFFRWLQHLARALPVGFLFGRLGCSIAHDHPGLPTNSIIGVQYRYGPQMHGGVEYRGFYDLGLLELFVWIFMAILFYLLEKKPRGEGFFLGLMTIIYTPVRFVFDFLRVKDEVYWGLTPGQYFCIVLFPVGIWLLLSSFKRPPVTPVDRMAESNDEEGESDGGAGETEATN